MRMFSLNSRINNGYNKQGTDTTCACSHFCCEDGPDNWMETHNLNKIDIATSLSLNSTKLDVIFYGDSITEEWNGRWMSHYTSRFEDVRLVFQKYFGNEDYNGNSLKGLALGVAGDKSPELLWRIQNEELPRSLNANIYWILIGTNDLLKGCDPSSILYWITKIINQIYQRKGSKAKIVINSIFPSGSANLLSSSNYIFEDTMHINQLLFQYSLKYKNLYFFNGTSLFLQDYNDNDNKDVGGNNNGLYVDNKLMPDYLHPNARGHTIWAEAIISFILNYIYI